MKYTAKRINASNVLVKLEQSMQIQSHYKKILIKTRNTLDCDQSNVYSSRVFFLGYLLRSAFCSFSVYHRLATLTLPYEISFESPSL